MPTESSQNKKANIWILNHYAITSNMPGGTRHYDFGKELVKRGYKVTIFASSFHYSQHKELKLNKKEKYKIENVDGINFIWLKTFPYQKNDWRRVVNMISYMWRVYWLGKKITKTEKSIKSPEVIIGSSVHLLAVLSAYWLARYYKSKFIMEVRDLWPQTLIDMKKFDENSLVIRILKLLEKFLYKKAEIIITLLPLAKEYISALGINQKKIVWISNGVDVSKLQEKEKKKGKANDGFKIIYIGAHGAANAIDVILDVAKILQERQYNKIKFIFVGDGMEKEQLIFRKEKLKLRNVEFYRSIAKKEIPLTLSQADASIISQRKMDLYKYGFSYNKLFDFMAVGKPIILAGKPANNLVVEAKCGISVPPENPEKMAEAIIELYKMSPGEREKMGRKGRKYVEKYHSIPLLVDELEKAIKEVVNE
ncbi:MAG: glycosyltransferase family 4 protein [Candidatus Pacebacteria bacterium]|nr:glycosyltransferase family 4 protein [Candidatus Paceibacterota bacterium]